MTMILFVLALVLGAGPESDIDQTLLLAHIRSLPASRTARARPEDRHVLQDTEEWLRQTLRDMGYDPVRQPIQWPQGATIRVRTKDGWTTSPDPNPVTWSNYYVEIPGVETPNEVIVVGAHFDSVPGTPGADDNASGTAAALEIARVLRDRPMRRTVRIVFFNLEEIDLNGSIAHAAWTKARIVAGTETVIGMVSLEMLGYFTDEPDSQRVPIPAIPDVFEPPTVGDFIALIADIPSQSFARAFARDMHEAEPDLKINLIDFIPAQGRLFPDVRRSDHAPFWDIGVPALLITDTSEFRTPYYHKPSDTIDTLDTDRMTRTVRAVAGAVWRMAGPIDSDK